MLTASHNESEATMETVSATSEFTGDIQEMVDRCRSLQSRQCWPGEHGQDIRAIRSGTFFRRR